MPETPRTPLGASTTARKYWVDVRPVGTTDWLPLSGITELTPKFREGNDVDDSDYDGKGWKSSTVTALTHGMEGKVKRATLPNDPTAYDPGQELVRSRAGKTGAQNRIEYRAYEMEPGGPRIESYQGFASPTWGNDGGNMEALDMVSFALRGQGELLEVPHPATVAAVPTISSISPTPGPLTATQVVIKGTGFPSGTPAVTFGGTAATAVNRLDATTILATMPVQASAGDTVVKVATGPTFVYARA